MFCMGLILTVQGRKVVVVYMRGNIWLMIRITVWANCRSAVPCIVRREGLSRVRSKLTLEFGCNCGLNPPVAVDCIKLYHSSMRGLSFVYTSADKRQCPEYCCRISTAHKKIEARELSSVTRLPHVYSCMSMRIGTNAHRIHNY